MRFGTMGDFACCATYSSYVMGSPVSASSNSEHNGAPATKNQKNFYALTIDVKKTRQFFSVPVSGSMGGGPGVGQGGSFPFIVQRMGGMALSRRWNMQVLSGPATM